MKVDQSLKKKVIQDWQKAFPELTQVGSNKLLKILGPLIVGLELIQLRFPNTKYRPYFQVYSLWGNNRGNDLKSCFYYPIFMEEYHNKKGFQVDVPYDCSEAIFLEAVELIKNNIRFPLEGDISLKQVLVGFEKYANTQLMINLSNSFIEAEFLEAQMSIALYISEANALPIFEKIQQRTSWNIDHFKAANVNLNEWLKMLENRINNRNEFLNIISTNKQDSKLKKLKISEIVS